ncbi:MAG: class I SAM-dependent methyltransferase [Vicinamibacterales bacterium]
MRTFRDHFSASSPAYARYRPGYPRALFDWIAAESCQHQRAWDCATGSGQAALGLAAHFGMVVGTDASEAQLASASPHPRVRYLRSAAEASGLASGSMDAVVAAQAVHWFDRPAFFSEAARVARRGALVAVWTYWTLLISPDIDARIAAFYADVVGPYWPPERRLIEGQYADVVMPFEPVAAPDLAIDLPMSLADVAGYLGTWSSTQRYREARGEDPVPALMESIAPPWGDPAASRPTRWPLAIRAGRVS